MRVAADTFGADRLVLGTDFPYEHGDLFRRAASYRQDGPVTTPPECSRPLLSRTPDGLIIGTGKPPLHDSGRTEPML
jgi:hypothetical protein